VDGWIWDLDFLCWCVLLYM